MDKNVYIMSIEGVKIWEHMHREKDLIAKPVGMLPTSLALDKLEKEGIKIIDSKRYNKSITRDVVNVKFNQKVRSSEEIIKLISKKINDDNKEKIEETIRSLRAKNYEEIKVEDLRTRLYNEGFTISYKSEKSDSVTEIEYVVYKRTASKSRTSQVLFVNKKLKDKMIKWSRLGINFDGAEDVDYPSLLAYESLVDSSIEDRIRINTKNILLISDVKSIFKCNVNLVKKGSNGLLESVPVDDYKMKSDLFDGEGLLDSSYFDNGKSMMLLRQHMFKCCVFNANIQQFLKDNCPTGQDFETWELKDMFDNAHLAKDVLMITSPNSLKVLKFSHKKKCNKEMYKHWRSKVEKEDCIFGICKQEKESKLGYDGEGSILQQTSYQMLNSMPFSLEHMQELSTFEVAYIDKLKNDDSTYVEYLTHNADNTNSNEMWVDLYNINPKIANTKQFKDKRKKDIHNYIKHCKKGKIRLNGDYCTIVQNGKELLYHAIGKLPVSKDGILDYDSWKDEMILKDNQVFTTLHPFNAEYVGFRNPHTSPSNVLIVENKDSEFIRTYFNLSDNIIYTNAINFEINRILSGQDVDSDNLVLFNNAKMLEVARKCYKVYRVCENGVDKHPNDYTINNTDMARIDNTLSDSQKFIGRVVNLGQLYMSKYWDMKAKGETDKDKLEKALRAVDICTILSEISIDMAKKLYKIDIEKEIKELASSDLLKDKIVPNFFINVSENENIGKRTEHHNTSVDYLYQILDNIEDANRRDTIQLNTLLVEQNLKKAKKRQLDSIIGAIEKMSIEIKAAEAEYEKKENTTKRDEEEKYNKINDIIAENMHVVKRYKLTEVNMYALIYRAITKDSKYSIECKYKTDFLNTLYRANKEIFLKAFKK